ncbi:MAG TPA: hypothetical protein VN151_15130 [Terracidiphilus sp.]|nr:hypothetical protein [Terracidiphilus sp.]
MKAALIILILLGIAASVAADYLWKRWMADRRQDRAPHGRNRP